MKILIAFYDQTQMLYNLLMPIISSTTKYDDHTQPDSRRGVWYLLTDHLGAVHSVGGGRLLSVDYLPATPTADRVFDEATGEAYLWGGSVWQLIRPTTHAGQEVRLADKEMAEILAALKIPNASNPLRNPDGTPKIPDHISYAEAQKRAMQYVMSSELNEALEYNEAAKYLQNNTDQDLIDLLGVDAAKVSEIRKWQTQLESVETAMSGYAPVMER